MAVRRARTAGKRLRQRLDKLLPAGMEWTEGDMVALELAEATADRLDQLRVKLAEELALPGTSRRAVDLAAEVRQTETQLGKLVTALTPEEPAQKSWQHQKAAHARWNRAPGA